MPEEAAEVYSRIRRSAERAGTSLSDNDLWIAATAMLFGAVLVTSDSDLKRVEGLVIEDWAI